MYLSRFGVKNYKCLGDIDIPLTPIHVLIGPNDAGKTSLLEAMEAFFSSSRKPLEECFPKPWSGRELVLHGAEAAVAEFWGQWESLPPPMSSKPITPLRYGLGVGFSQGRIRGRSGECHAGQSWIGVRGEYKKIPGIMDSRPYPPRFMTRSQLAEWPEPFRDAHAAIGILMGDARRHAFDPKVMATPAALQPERRFRLDLDGFGLATLLSDIVAYDAGLFIRLRQEFCRLFPQFASVRMESESAVDRVVGSSGTCTSKKANGYGIYLETRTGQTVRAQQASDGAILLLGFLALAHLPQPPALLLIDEPENGVYPKRLGEVIRILKEMVSRDEGPRFPQIILTTHSPFVLSFFEPEEVTFLSRDPKKPDAGVRARPMRDAPKIRERLGGGAFYLGELWYNLSEEDLFGEPKGKRRDRGVRRRKD